LHSTFHVLYLDGMHASLWFVAIALFGKVLPCPKKLKKKRKAMKDEHREGMVFPSYAHYWHIELSCNLHLAFQNWHVNCCKGHVKAIIAIKT
jgi:hypothetical protein